MIDRSDNNSPTRPGTRPFVGGRAVQPDEPMTFSYAPARPFSFTGGRAQPTAQTRTGSTAIARSKPSATPLWSVAIYEPGLEQISDAPSARTVRNPADEYAEASLALADDVVEAQRHASSLAAADVLDLVARRLRRGEILLLPGASTQTEAAVVSSVLAALLGGRR